MKKLLGILVLGLFFSTSVFSNEISLTILDKIFQEGKKVCNEEGYGDHLLTDNPITLIDISNDGIKDLIINTRDQRCEESYSIFSGGTGGNNFIFFINPTIDIAKLWDPSQFGDDEQNRIFTMLIQNYESFLLIIKIFENMDTQAIRIEI